MKNFCYSLFLKDGHTTPTGPHKEGHKRKEAHKEGVWTRRRKGLGNTLARAFTVFPAGKARHDRISSLGLSSLYNSGRLWEWLSPSCLAPGFQLTREGERLAWCVRV